MIATSSPTIASPRSRFQCAYELGWNRAQFQESILGCDTETEAIKGPDVVPALALCSVSDGDRTVILHADDAAEFLVEHSSAHLVFHNVGFDFWVLDHHFRSHGHRAAGEALWAMVSEDRLHDSMLLDLLLRLAESDAFPSPRDLGTVAQEYANLKLDKADPYRMRFGEIIGKPFDQVDPRFFEYASADSTATLLAYAAMVERADIYAERHPELVTADQFAQFGRFSEAIQVKGAIALAAVQRQGIRTDAGQLAESRILLTEQRDQRIVEIQQLIENNPNLLQFPTLVQKGLFKTDSKGRVLFTEKGMPQMNNKNLQLMLAMVAAEIERDEGKRVELVRTDTSRQISTSAEHWQEYRDRHPIIRVWMELNEITKLAQFANTDSGSVIHSRYDVLARTGRTRSSKPNLQQLPRKGGIRECFVPSPDHLFLSVDYSFIELRTLASVCLQRFGHSALAEVIKAGIDPHCHTAAMMRGIPLAEFMALKDVDEAEFGADRQRAKAINFGIPGGLGAAALVAYARNTYGVDMSLEDAESLRSRLINEVYPELALHLADDGMAILARNLRTSEEQCWSAFGFNGNRNRPIIGAIKNVARGRTTKANGTPYNERWYDSVWDNLSDLNSNPDLAPFLAQRRGSNELCDRMFQGGVATLTGRVRGRVAFCQARNTPFQGLAADGAKLALFDLIGADYRVVAFPHDEFIIELPEQCDHLSEAQRVSKIMCDAMERVLGEVPAGCEFALMRRWHKGAKAVYDAQGRLIPWEPKG